MSLASTGREIERMLPHLLFVQTHLDEDLSLGALARRAGLSASRFHRLFRGVVGETPKRHVQRLRLERAAVELLVSRTKVLEIALDCGFRNHETFSRAFRRQFGCSPRRYRASGRPARSRRARGTRLAEHGPHFELSATRIRELDAFEVAFVRQVGPYEAVDPEPWQRLEAWASRHGLGEAPFLLGIAQDPPGITPPDRLRFDAAVRLSDSAAPEGPIGIQTVAAGAYATTTHVGPYSTLAAAYRTTYERVAAMRRYRFVGFPAIEMYHASQIALDYQLNRTDIWLPVTVAGTPR